MQAAGRLLAAVSAWLLAAGLALSGGEVAVQAQSASVADAAASVVPFTARVSVTSQERQMDGSSVGATVSSDGRMVAFVSVQGPVGRVFVRDNLRGTTRLVSRGNDGHLIDAKWAQISGDGRSVVFDSPRGVYVRDLQTRTTIGVSRDRQGQMVGGWSTWASISADGRYVAFASNSASLVPGDTDQQADVFVRDLLLRRTVRVSVSSSGRQANGESIVGGPVVAGGRLVFFLTRATTLTPNHRAGLLGHNLVTGRTWWIAPWTPLMLYTPRSVNVSADGRFLVFPKRYRAGTKSCPLGAFVLDRLTGETRAVSFDNESRRLPDIGDVSISAEGRYIAFSTVYPGPADHYRGIQQVVLRDRQLHRTRLVSVALNGRGGDAGSWGADVSAGGRVVAFTSVADNLVSHDTNLTSDTFIRRLW